MGGPERESIVLPGGRRAVAVCVPADVSGADAVVALGLPAPRGVIVLNGETREGPADLDAELRRSIEEIARVAVDERLTLVTGGTDAGIFGVLGQALDDLLGAPCVGVAPEGLVTWPGRASPDDAVPLEPHHSHFLLVAGDEWGVETEAMLALAGALSVGCASLAVVAGGGSGARTETLGHVRAGREVVAITGSGRFADELARAVSHGGAHDSETAEIAASGLVTVVDVAEPSSLAELIRARLVVADAEVPS